MRDGRKKEEGRRKTEEGRRKKEDGNSATSNVRDVTDGRKKKEAIYRVALGNQERPNRQGGISGKMAQKSIDLSLNDSAIIET
ncbi:hypothetical protein [Microcoleus sp. bin38.metabat.b11b12b14.051]|uniref:hypothetical protein n=1 Tax=Microcoleus sp. bin38.metabat.b11b12b14.051 TaxID=2742709 RepID=UPI0025FC5CFC|nr:hypothetical protein [Microcoleus sp. bin38.metabat.b11b12b14.051]